MATTARLFAIAHLGCNRGRGNRVDIRYRQRALARIVVSQLLGHLLFNLNGRVPLWRRFRRP